MLKTAESYRKEGKRKRIVSLNPESGNPAKLIFKTKLTHKENVKSKAEENR